MAVPSSWVQTRHALMLELAALPREGDLLQWQRRLADAIIDAESPPAGVDRAEARWHRHLLRVIADGLVHSLLPEHTIRSLSRHPGKPASLSAQGVDFDFVFEQANGLLSLGLTPIISDLTTLIGVGDIVGLSGDGVVVLECKNRPVPAREATTGRLARQRRRGEQVETYLTASRIDEGDIVRQAYEMSLPTPDWDAVADLLDRCDASPSGTAAYSLGPADTLVAAISDSTPEQFMDVVPKGGEAAHTAIAFYSELIETASYRLMAPSSYPIGGEYRSRLLEGALQLVRLADVGGLAAEFDHDGSVVALVPERSNGRLDLRIDIDGQEFSKFTHQLAEFGLWMPVPLAALRQTLIEFASALLDERASGVELSDSPGLAPGDNFTYMTVYRPD
ncbi:hypothetical protein [Cellulomonas fengjieae]|uniref:PD-(D/E)XK endonuclease-like domain-containing protein n=1 Tax=Cellulomonas fengjieae TaxID=2819978 RepID=A0ABS3SB94_9CELL|nr:hypothetical protein [Cellulomonas fengjieae]MBO3083023.1 hypothetical protein [Cellulomonas fengjieae]QVI65606.1 hypothetical protein KG102_16155 [Cellulomonas fengjieae]